MPGGRGMPTFGHSWAISVGRCGGNRRVPAPTLEPRNLAGAGWVRDPTALAKCTSTRPFPPSVRDVSASLKTT